MDPFSRLPFPLLMMIVKDVPDLLSLHSLRCASPAFADLFLDADLGLEIVDAVISASLAPLTQDVVRLACLSIGQPPASWDSLLRLCTEIRVRDQTLAQAAAVVAPDLSAASVRRLLALACAVHAAAYRCLGTVLARCQALRPRWPIDPKYTLHPQQFWRHSRGKPYEPLPPIADEPIPLDPVAVADTSPLCWVEVQRALYGAWRLACLNVVRSALLANLPVEESVVLSTADEGPLPSLILGPLPFWETLGLPLMSQVFTTNEYFQTLLDDETTEEDLVSHQPVDPDVDNPDEAPPPTPVDEEPPTISTCPRLADVFPAAAASTTLAAASVPYHFADDVLPMPSTWEPGLSGLGADQWSPAFMNICRVAHWSPLRHTEVRPFRALGFFLWEKPRMVASGFCCDDDTRITRFGDKALLVQCSYLYTWRSLLTSAQMATLEDRQRRAWDT